jgi:hypothetical protein
MSDIVIGCQIIVLISSTIATLYTVIVLLRLERAIRRLQNR